MYVLYLYNTRKKRKLNEHFRLELHVCIVFIQEKEKIE